MKAKKEGGLFEAAFFTIQANFRAGAGTSIVAAAMLAAVIAAAMLAAAVMTCGAVAGADPVVDETH